MVWHEQYGCKQVVWCDKKILKKDPTQMCSVHRVIIIIIIIFTMSPENLNSKQDAVISISTVMYQNLKIRFYLLTFQSKYSTITLDILFLPTSLHNFSHSHFFIFVNLSSILPDSLFCKENVIDWMFCIPFTCWSLNFPTIQLDLETSTGKN